MGQPADRFSRSDREPRVRGLADAAKSRRAADPFEKPRAQRPTSMQPGGLSGELERQYEDPERWDGMS